MQSTCADPTTTPTTGYLSVSLPRSACGRETRLRAVRCLCRIPWILPREINFACSMPALHACPLPKKSARCNTFAKALPSQPDSLNNEDLWAFILTDCSRFALRSRNTALSASLEDVVTKQFLSRNFEEMRL